MSFDTNSDGQAVDFTDSFDGSISDSSSLFGSADVFAGNTPNNSLLQTPGQTLATVQQQQQAGSAAVNNGQPPGAGGAFSGWNAFGNSQGIGNTGSANNSQGGFINGILGSAASVFGGVLAAPLTAQAQAQRAAQAQVNGDQNKKYLIIGGLALAGIFLLVSLSHKGA